MVIGMRGADIGECAMPGAPEKDGTLTARTGADGEGMPGECEGSAGDTTAPCGTDRGGVGAGTGGAEETLCCPSEGEGSADVVSVEAGPVG